MTFDELKEKALSLPYAPGVYIMRDKTDKVIYVGKAKKLKNRVSQYFQDTASHTPKTRLMVSKIHHFDVIVAASEFEALVLECSLIKRYMPKYNILLKDDKGYPYLRLNMKDIYPVITMVSKPADDGADYYGPYGGRAVTHDVMEAIRLTLKLPGCHKQFPRDIGKERPCLNYHMNQCAGWCQENKSCTEYRETMLQARELLKGNYKAVAEQLRGQMLAAADNLEFELAASLRDRLNAVENLPEPGGLPGAQRSIRSAPGRTRTAPVTGHTEYSYSDPLSFIRHRLHLPREIYFPSGPARTKPSSTARRPRSHTCRMPPRMGKPSYGV